MSHPFVASVRRSLVTVSSEKPTERTYTTKHGTQATMKIGKAPKAVEETAPADETKPIAPPEQTDEAYDDFGPSAEEIAASISETEADLNAMRKVFEADDRLGAAMAEIKRLNEYVRVLETRVNGLMEEKTRPSVSPSPGSARPRPSNPQERRHGEPRGAGRGGGASPRASPKAAPYGLKRCELCAARRGQRSDRCHAGGDHVEHDRRV